MPEAVFFVIKLGLQLESRLSIVTDTILYILLDTKKDLEKCPYPSVCFFAGHCNSLHGFRITRAHYCLGKPDRLLLHQDRGLRRQRRLDDFEPNGRLALGDHGFLLDHGAHEKT